MLSKNLFQLYPDNFPNNYFLLSDKIIRRYTVHVSCEFQHLLFHSIFVLDLGHIVTNRVLTSFYFMVMRH